MSLKSLSSKQFFLATLVCLSSGLFFMYEFFQLGILNYLNDILRAEYNITGVTVSRLSNAYSLGNILFLLPAGVLLDKYSTKKIILITISVCILGTLGIAMSSSIYLIIFSRFLTGIGNAFCLAAGVVLIARWLPEKHQALFIGLLVTMAYLGGILNGPPFLYLIDSYGWRSATMIDVVFGVIILLWLLIILKDSPDPNFRTKELSQNIKITTGLKESLMNQQNWLAGTYTALINLPVMIFGALWGIPYLEDVHLIAEETGSQIIVFFYLGAIIGCPLFGWISDKISRRKPIMYFGSIGSILIFLPIIFGVKFGFIGLCLLFFCIGLICGTQVIAYPLISESNTNYCIAKSTSIATFLVMILGSASSTIFAFILDIYTPDNSKGYLASAYQTASIVFIVGFVLALIMTYFVKETYCKRNE